MARPGFLKKVNRLICIQGPVILDCLVAGLLLFFSRLSTEVTTMVMLRVALSLLSRSCDLDRKTRGIGRIYGGNRRQQRRTAACSQDSGGGQGKAIYSCSLQVAAPHGHGALVGGRAAAIIERYSSRISLLKYAIVFPNYWLAI
jgi:hypothetical protein